VGIDILGPNGDGDREGPTPNDACNAEGGGTGSLSNDGANYPVLTAASSSGGLTNVEGTLNSRPNRTYRIEFFASATCDASGHGEGTAFLGSTSVSTDANCNATINATLPAPVPDGQLITATATDPDGNTSEFSACLAVCVSLRLLDPHLARSCSRAKASPAKPTSSKRTAIFRRRMRRSGTPQSLT